MDQTESDADHLSLQICSVQSFAFYVAVSLGQSISYNTLLCAKFMQWISTSYYLIHWCVRACVHVRECVLCILHLCSNNHITLCSHIKTICIAPISGSVLRYGDCQLASFHSCFCYRTEVNEIILYINFVQCGCFLYTVA